MQLLYNLLFISGNCLKSISCVQSTRYTTFDEDKELYTTMNIMQNYQHLRVNIAIALTSKKFES